MHKKNLIIGIVVVVAVAGTSFYGGMAYAKGKAPSRGQFANGQFMAGGQFAGGAGRGAGGLAAGKVLSQGAGSITVQTPDGSTKIVLVATSTSILKTSSGSANDLAPGTMVSIIGSTNSDGSITAQSVQIRPAGFQAPMRPAPAQ